VEGLIWGINEMVQGPYAHVVLPWQNLCWFHRFLSLHRDTKHSTPDCTVTEYVQSFRPIARRTQTDERWPLWPWKVGQIKNPGIMSCILISWGVRFRRIKLDRNLVCELLLPSSTSVLPLPVGTCRPRPPLSKKSVDFDHEIMENEKKLWFWPWNN
jgi:hypothetical protein